MDRFEQFENNGRSLLKGILDQTGICEQKASEGTFNPIDYYFTVKGKKVVAEIKCRNVLYQNFDTHLIECQKLKSLIRAKKNNKCDLALYVNFFGEDTCYLYSTESIITSAKQQILNCNRKTAIKTDKIDKQILMIPSNQALVLKRINGSWKHIN